MVCTRADHLSISPALQAYTQYKEYLSVAHINRATVQQKSAVKTTTTNAQAEAEIRRKGSNTATKAATKHVKQQQGQLKRSSKGSKTSSDAVIKAATGAASGERNTHSVQSI